MRFSLSMVLLFACGAVATQVAFSHEPAARGATTPATEFGSPGNARDVRRVIDVSLLDTMHIVPDRLSVKQGETVRLRITNSGATPHEFVLGTKKEIDEHHEMMRTMPTMKHADPNAVSVAPGTTADLIWRFSRPGTFLYACLIPGHWESGMQGTVTVGAVAKPR
jgi:uncharacterized cupredoxin-like copper-binding protein